MSSTLAVAAAALLIVVALGAGRQVSRSMKQPPPPDAAGLRARLSPAAYRCTQEGATEPPFHNAFWDHHDDGIYVDVVDGEPLFGSLDKFDSGSGWPSFTRPLSALRTVEDRSLGMARTEVRSAGANSHLGHLFDDGPGPDHRRYCINSAALRFVPLAAMAESGYGAYLFAFAGKMHWQVATLAGGCFWGMEKMFQSIPGVVQTQVGYAGGDLARGSYREVMTGQTGHAEALQVLFDPKQVSYAELLLKFFSVHDPTTRDRQGNDRGSQYRSSIFFASPEQASAARAVIARVNKSGRWPKPVVTEVVAYAGFVRAEAEHQKYLDQHPNGYSCHVDRQLTF